jgi:histidinol-phosphate aminotransferase
MDVDEILKQSVLPHVRKIVPYPPGKPIEELEREWGITGSIKLASNENPLGPSPKAVAAMRDVLAKLHRYPDGSGYYLRQRVSEKFGVPFDCVLLGNGSNEIIDMAVRTFVGPGDQAITSVPAFLMYSKLVQVNGGEIVEVPLRSLGMDLDAILRAVTEKTKLIFLTNPNNPTGATCGTAEFVKFLNDVPARIILLLDEAYIEFMRDSGSPQGIDYFRDYPNLIVTRTFSKAYGLAGARIGYGFAHPQIASVMNRVRQPFNANSLGQAGAIGALDDDEFVRKTQSTIWEGLSYLYDALDRMGLHYVPTQANFFLIKVGKARKVYEDMLAEGVIIRSMDSYGLDEFIRVNVGLPEENDRFIAALKSVLNRK